MEKATLTARDVLEQLFNTIQTFLGLILVGKRVKRLMLIAGPIPELVQKLGLHHYYYLLERWS